jgi:hypothetical protein
MPVETQRQRLDDQIQPGPFETILIRFRPQHGTLAYGARLLVMAF